MERQFLSHDTALMQVATSQDAPFVSTMRLMPKRVMNGYP